MSATASTTPHQFGTTSKYVVLPPPIIILLVVLLPLVPQVPKQLLPLVRSTSPRTK